MQTGRPFLAAALICEKVLEEKDGVFSVIRIVDKALYDPPPEGITPVLEFYVVVSLKSGLFRGKGTISIVPNSPSGKRMEGAPKFDAVFQGDEFGANLIGHLRIAVREDGLYWLDVLFNDDVITRIPLRVIRKEPRSQR